MPDKPISKQASFHMQEELKKYMTPEVINFGLVSWYRYMFPYIPFVTGTLASLVTVNDSVKTVPMPADEALQSGIREIQSNPDNVIHFRAPYASRQNGGKGFNFTRDLHPLAQAQWEQVAADVHGEQIVNEIKNFVKRSVNK